MQISQTRASHGCNFAHTIRAVFGQVTCSSRAMRIAALCEAPAFGYICRCSNTEGRVASSGLLTKPFGPSAVISPNLDFVQIETIALMALPSRLEHPTLLRDLINSHEKSVGHVCPGAANGRNKLASESWLMWPTYQSYSVHTNENKKKAADKCLRMANQSERKCTWREQYWVNNVRCLWG